MFKVGELYTRENLLALLGVPEAERAGDWFTGYHQHKEQWFVFAGVGVPGRTGHNYGNRWVGNDLLWRGKTTSRMGQPAISDLLGGSKPVHIFWRTDDRAAFTYAGRATAVRVEDTQPVTVLWSFDLPGQVPEGTLPEETPPGRYPEGATKRIVVNAYERDPAARRACLAHHGYSCVACGFSFHEVYGPLGYGYIHVHHLKPLSEVGEEYLVDPVSDMRPLCPNCHAMIHQRVPALSIEELRSILHEASERTATATGERGTSRLEER